MPGSDKKVVKYGLLSIIEAVYGTAPAMAGATDGIDIIRPFTLNNAQYEHDGARAGKSPATHGGRKRVGRMGRYGSGSVFIEPVGAGVAYAAGVKPNVDAWLRAGGFTAAVDTTPGTEKWTYTPHAADSEESLALEWYYRGEKKVLSGVYANTKLTCPVPGIPMFEFACQGLSAALPSDSAVPAITYTALEPPKAEQVALTIGGWAVGNLRNIEVEVQRNVSARYYDAVNGLHGGFNVGVERTVIAKFQVEADPFASYNPFSLMELGTTGAIAFDIGATQYLKMSFGAATAQLVDIEEGEEGAAAVWGLTYECKPSSLTANDECSFVFD